MKIYIHSLKIHTKQPSKLPKRVMERLIHSNKIGTVINFFHNAKVIVIKEQVSS